MTALLAISMGVIVVVGGVEATFKTKFLICECVKFELLSDPPSFSFLLVEYMYRLQFIIFVPVEASQ